MANPEAVAANFQWPGMERDRQTLLAESFHIQGACHECAAGDTLSDTPCRQCRRTPRRRIQHACAYWRAHHSMRAAYDRARGAQC